MLIPSPTKPYYKPRYITNTTPIISQIAFNWGEPPTSASVILSKISRNSVSSGVPPTSA